MTMAALQSIWNGFLSAWIRFGTAVFPRTIHPMVLHFPIALLYLAVLIEIFRYLVGREQNFLQRAGFWVLTLSLFAIAAAAATGVLSEHYVRWTPQTAAMLSKHQTFAVLTGLFAFLSWVVRLLSKTKPGQWSVLGRGQGRATILSSLLLVAATAMITITGSLGGSMVYHYGVGTPPTLIQKGTLPSHTQAAVSGQ